MHHGERALLPGFERPGREIRSHVLLSDVLEPIFLVFATVTSH